MHTPQAPVPPPHSPASSPAGQERFVFLDQRGKRWPRFRRLAFAASLLLFVAVILFVQTLVLPSSLHLPPAVEQLKSRLKARQQPKHGSPVSKPLWLDYAKKDRDTKHAAHGKEQGPSRRQAAAAAHSAAQEIRLGFFESWDPDSLDSLKAHADELTHLSPDWLHLVDGSGNVKVTADQEIVELIHERKLRLMPLLRNLGDGDAWQAEAVE